MSAANRRCQSLVVILLAFGCNSDPAGPTVFHVANYYFVDRESFAADLRDQDSRVTDAEIHDQFVGFINTVEIIQNEQMQLLRAEIRKHGIRTVFVEGLLEGDQEVFLERSLALRDINLERPLQLIKETEDAELRNELQEVVESVRIERLRLGAVGVLLAENEIDRVLPM